jgi:hypothetical protein
MVGFNCESKVNKQLITDFWGKANVCEYQMSLATTWTQTGHLLGSVIQEAESQEKLIVVK